MDLFGTAGNESVVEVTTAKGLTFTLAIDSSTKLPSRVVSMSENANMGDVAIVTTFSGYEDVGGLKLPRRLTTNIDKYLQFDLNVTRNAVDADTGDLAAPADVKAAAPPPPAVITVTAEPTQESRRPALEVLVLGGKPIREPVVAYGPFVMNSKSELVKALEDYNAGKFGAIPPNALMPHRIR